MKNFDIPFYGKKPIANVPDPTNFNRIKHNYQQFARLTCLQVVFIPLLTWYWIEILGLD